MVLNKQGVKEFVEEFNKKYKEESELSEFAEVIQFKEKYGNLDYYKVGRRVGLPTIVINGSADPLMIISSFVRRLRIGERNYVLRNLNRLAEQNDINSIPINNIAEDSLAEWCSEVDDPNHLFLPMDSEYFREAPNWGANIPEYELKVHWVPLDQNINHGFLLNSSNVTVVRKTLNDIGDPDEFDHNSNYDKFSMNQPIPLYFGKKTFIDSEQDQKYQKQVDLLYFSMLSEILTSRGDAVRLEPQKDLSSE